MKIQVKVSKKIVGLITIGVAVMVIMVAMSVLKLFYLTKDYEKTQATITKIDWKTVSDTVEGLTTTYNIYFDYTVGDKSYSGQLKTNIISGYKEGKRLVIHYDPVNPEILRPLVREEIITLVGLAAMLSFCLLALVKGEYP